MLQAALPNGFRLRMLPRSVPAVFRQTGEIFYIGGADVLPAPLEGQAEADAIAGLSDPENETARSELIEHNLRLVVYIAQKFDNTGVGVEDLISIGTDRPHQGDQHVQSGEKDQARHVRVPVHRERDSDVSAEKQQDAHGSFD